MSPMSIGVLAVSISVDAFVASLGKGASIQRPAFATCLKTGLIFGSVEAITPVIGWAAGMAAARYVALVDHWIAFTLLSAVGLHMALQAWRRPADTARSSVASWATLATAAGTSVDAMAIGVSLSMLDANILLIALTIGVTTMVMTSTGVMLGRFIGERFGRVAETLGGLTLIVIGSAILWDHLSAAPFAP